jgi:iron(III) transport system permease protein
MLNRFPPLTIALSIVCFVLLIGLMVTPVVVVLVGGIFRDGGATWQHLWDTVLADYVWNTLYLVVGVTGGVIILGTATAWLVSACEFWGRRWLEWLLVLPLAMPAYLLAYLYTDFLEYYGLAQVWLRSIFGWQSASDYWFPPVRNLWGAIIMFSLALYPYVYLVVRVAFLQQSACILEASRALGCNPWQGFGRVAVPLARPAIIGGATLAIMETLNDYGTVQYFGVSTFTAGIYRTWFGLGDKPAALQLAAVLTLVALAVFALELWSRGNQRFEHVLGKPTARFRLHPLQSIGAWVVCGLPVGLGFLLPAGLLIHLCLSVWDEMDTQDWWQLAQNSFGVSVVAALIGGLCALALAYLQRTFSNPLTRGAVKLSAMGYGMPGAVIAVGIMIPLGFVDQKLDEWFATGLFLSGTIGALVYAYNIRFLAVALNSVESSLSKVKPNLDEASRSLGQGIWGTLGKIHAPLIQGGVLAGIIFLFVDTLKELPATIVMRPFNFETLAVRVFTYAADERLREAAFPALAILAVGLLPVGWLSWQISRSGRR